MLARVRCSDHLVVTSRMRLGLRRIHKKLALKKAINELTVYEKLKNLKSCCRTNIQLLPRNKSYGTESQRQLHTHCHSVCTTSRRYDG